MTDQEWARLAQFVTRRRSWLGLTQEEIAAAGGPSTATMRLIEGALQDSYRGRTLRSLERALGWQPGSVRDILEGGEPRLVGGSPQVDRDPDVAAIEDYPGYTREEKDLMLAVLYAKRGQLPPPRDERRQGEGA